MLARRRELRLGGAVIERTPLLVPSFSSKGFPEIKEIVRTTSEVIEGAALFSAYDVHFHLIEPPFEFPSLIFLDSGGYEASKDTDLAELGDYEHHPRNWRIEFHEEALQRWRSRVPTVFISYDNPVERLDIASQIERARNMARGRTDVIREILIKPETRARRYIDMPSLLRNVEALRAFDVIGVTEKEIGNSIHSRMANIARLRKTMDQHELDLPIHVFGSLDTVTTPMYFLAGADIFDGLTWLRFAYREGFTIYKHNYGATELGINISAHVIDGRCWFHNYGYLVEMQLEMRRFLNRGDFASFRHHSPLFERALGSVQELIGD